MQLVVRNWQYTLLTGTQRPDAALHMQRYGTLT
jgi:hypothetical protein